MSTITFTLASAVESTLLATLIQLVIIIAAARLFGALFKKMGQPVVVGEIAAGLALGPSLLGWLAPGLSAAIFTPEVAPILEVLAQLGLVFLLFLIGLEFDFEHLKVSGLTSGMISLAGIALPFALGAALGWYIHPYLAPDFPRFGFVLFMGTSMSITAIPILGRIMMEFNITRTRLGAVTITAAAVDDAVGWILLATVTALVMSMRQGEAGGGFSVWHTAQMLGLTIGFAVLVIVLLRPVLMWWTRSIVRRGEMGLNAMATLIILLFLCAVATSLIGIFAIFGAFILGAALSGDKEFRAIASAKFSDFVTAFFLPIFFTYTGLRTDVGSLNEPWLWGVAALVIGVAIAGKFGGCALAARLSGMSWNDSLLVGTMMNTRALMELIVINVGFSLGVINQELFCMLVLMALLTTIMTSPIVLALIRRDPELNALLAQSSFASRARVIVPATADVQQTSTVNAIS